MDMIAGEGSSFAAAMGTLMSLVFLEYISNVSGRNG